MKSIFARLSHTRNRYLLLLDALIMLSAPYIAAYMRTESAEIWRSFAWTLALFSVSTAAFKLVVLYYMDMYVQYWPYASVQEMGVLTRALVVAFLGELSVFYIVLLPAGLIPVGFPHSTPWIDGLLSACFVGSTRLSIRLACTLNSVKSCQVPPKPVLIVGAGVAGSMVVKELARNQQVGERPVGFLDDDPAKLGKCIHGISVLGPLADLPKVVQTTRVKDVIIAIPTAPGRLIRQIVESCKSAGVSSKTVPGLFEILRGSARVDQLREVRLEDLLRREVVHSDTQRVAKVISGARVLVTGAGGSIGSEICRQVLDFRPAHLILLGHGENSIFNIATELSQLPGKEQYIVPVIADIRDRSRMEQVFRTYSPDIVFHAAAHKHLPLMEANVPDAVTNNVLGTKILVDLAAENGTGRFVLISTDKAVNPTSVLGVTKRIAEMVVHDAGHQTGLKFITVRFGNVLGSRGSVVPVFEQQIRQGGPLRLTHRDVKRFFMTIPEAVQLVLQSAATGEGGEIFVLDMGEQVRIVDLASDLVRLNGLDLGRDIEIVFTGLKPGEKMCEELFFENEKVDKTCHEKILVCRNGAGTLIGNEDQICPDPQNPLDKLLFAAEHGNLAELGKYLKQIVPQYCPAIESYKEISCSEPAQRKYRQPECRVEPSIPNRRALLHKTT